MAGSSALDILLRAKRAGRLHHAALLYGSSLRELEDTAMAVASELFGRPAHRHPDLFELRPEGKMRLIKIGSDSDRVGGEWPPNTMRKLLKDLRQTSSQGGAKVAIIHEADRMNAVAANAFLKTLEEPPERTTIFMLTTRPNDLLNTIRSRCIALRVDCRPQPIDDDEWLQWLDDFKNWQRSLMGGVGKKVSLSDAIMNCYGLLARFDCVLSRLTDAESDLDDAQKDDLDDEMLEAVAAGERRAIRKKMFADIENACVSCALGGAGVPAVKLGRAVDALEKSSGFMELNMQDAPALEYFMLNCLRIWSR